HEPGRHLPVGREGDRVLLDELRAIAEIDHAYRHRTRIYWIVPAVAAVSLGVADLLGIGIGVIHAQENSEPLVEERLSIVEDIIGLPLVVLLVARAVALAPPRLLAVEVATEVVRELPALAVER